MGKQCGANDSIKLELSGHSPRVSADDLGSAAAHARGASDAREGVIMSPRIALNDFVFRAHVDRGACDAPGRGGAIPVLGKLRRCDVSGVWRTYYGWLLMVPLVTLAGVSRNRGDG